MTEQDPTLQDVWRLLGTLNRRVGGFDQRFDVIERHLVALDARISARISAVEAGIAAKIGALKDSIEARDFRLDDHGRRLSKLEESLPTR
jgi:hypothetical protein